MMQPSLVGMTLDVPGLHGVVMANYYMLSARQQMNNVLKVDPQHIVIEGTSYWLGLTDLAHEGLS